MENNLNKLAIDLIGNLKGFVDSANKQLNNAVRNAPKEQQKEILKKIKDADIKKKFAKLKRDINALKK